MSIRIAIERIWIPPSACVMVNTIGAGRGFVKPLPVLLVSLLDRGKPCASCLAHEKGRPADSQAALFDQ